MIRSATVRVPQDYHLDISHIQHHPKSEISAISVRLSMPQNPLISTIYISAWQWLMPVVLAGITFRYKQRSWF
ncbi:MAG: hypothetical protein ABIL06_16070 [Pseudomonadota bacterium]